MSKLNISESTRIAATAELTDIWHKKGDFIEVTEWSNGEGWDICVNNNHIERTISLHETEWSVLKKLIKHLESK